MKSVYPLLNKGRYRLIVRNHWNRDFNDTFLIVVDANYCDPLIRVYRVGFLNIAFVLFVEKKQSPNVGEES